MSVLTSEVEIVLIIENEWRLKVINLDLKMHEIL